MGGINSSSDILSTLTCCDGICRGRCLTSRFVFGSSFGNVCMIVVLKTSILELENSGARRHPTSSNFPLFYVSFRGFFHSFSNLLCISTLQCWFSDAIFHSFSWFHSFIYVWEDFSTIFSALQCISTLQWWFPDLIFHSFCWFWDRIFHSEPWHETNSRTLLKTYGVIGTLLAVVWTIFYTNNLCRFFTTVVIVNITLPHSVALIDVSYKRDISIDYPASLLKRPYPGVWELWRPRDVGRH